MSCAALIVDIENEDSAVTVIDSHEADKLDSRRSQPDQIRLLSFEESTTDVIRCKLRPFGLGHLPIYTALSYVWGDPTAHQQYLYVGNEPFSVGRNLYEVLTKLRDLKDGCQYFWIDAICIDQSDVEERNDQVKLMGSIYRSAQTVFAWLGQSSESSDRALPWIRQLHSRFKGGVDVKELFSNSGTESLLLDVASLFERPYFSRIWIVQELVLGTQVTVNCGDESCDAEALAFVQEAYDQWDIGGVRWHLFQRTHLSTADILDFKGWWEISYTKDLMERDSRRAFDALRVNDGRVCSNPKDMVYGMFGLRHANETAQTVDYNKSVGTVYIEFFEQEVMSSKSLLILTHAWAGSRAQTEACKSITAPSWIFDWSYPFSRPDPLMQIRDPPIKFFKASQTKVRQGSRDLARRGCLDWSYQGSWPAFIPHSPKRCQDGTIMLSGVGRRACRAQLPVGLAKDRQYSKNDG